MDMIEAGLIRSVRGNIADLDTLRTLYGDRASDHPAESVLEFDFGPRPPPAKEGLTPRVSGVTSRQATDEA